MMAATTSKQPWARCNAIPAAAVSSDTQQHSADTPHCTYYGPGELETYKHRDLLNDVKRAKLKIWYPGNWHLPSPRALFRIHLTIAKNRNNNLVLLRFLSNSKIVSTWLYSPDVQCSQRQTSTLQWVSKLLMKIGSNERVYEHTLISVLPYSSEKYCEKAVGDWFKNFCVIVELDTSGEDHSSEELSNDEYSELRLHAPPCISLLKVPGDLTTIHKVEWKSSPLTSDYTSARGIKIPIPTSNSDDDLESSDARMSSWLFPHQRDLCKVSTLHPTTVKHTRTENSNEIIFDFGREALGHVRITIVPSNAVASSASSVVPPIQLRVGETLAEALNDNEEHFEQSIDLCVDNEDDDAIWSSSHLLAFRYVRVIFASDDIDRDKVSVVCRSHEAPLDNIGAFDFGSDASSDNLLDKRIWDCAAATLKLCIRQNFIVDGIKRDRLPWLGDVVVSLMANAYSFHDVECIRWTLSVLGRCGMGKLYDETNDTAEEMDARVQVAESHVNGIVDYSLWFFICHWLYQRYFGDELFLQQEWPLLETRLMDLVILCSDREKGWFIEHESEWVFIDWTVEGAKSIPLQILWWWALNCAHEMANSLSSVVVDDIGREDLVRFMDLVHNVQSKLETSLLESDDIQRGYMRHAHLLGIISGLYSRLEDRARGNCWWDPDTSDERVCMIKKCRKLVEESRAALLGKELGGVVTPYMKHLECLALINLGERSAALDEVRKYWGGMLKTDATSFYEAFNEEETIQDVVAFYDRPFARSLCHAWSAGACSLYPEILLGIRPLSAGWKEWSCSPLEGVSSITCEVNTMFGTILLHLDQSQLRVNVPAGTRMKLMNKNYEGGLHCIPRSALISSELTKQWSKKYRGWHYHDGHVIPPNPIIVGHEGIQMTDVPTVFQLRGDETFYMSFIGFDGVGYQSFIAESSDLIEWTNIRLAMGYGEDGAFDHGGVVLGAYLYESYHIDAPRVLKKTDDDKFISLYGAYAKKNAYEPDPGFQGLASSCDGINWKREKDESILSIHGPGEVKDWEKHSIYQPWLVEQDGMYYNFYNAKQMPEWIEQIGIAKSQCLLEWERHDDNPIICVGNDGYDTQFCSDAKVFWDDIEKHWVMFFYGVGLGGAHIMIAFSRDLIHWERDTTPLYKAGGNPSGLDTKYAHKVSLVYNSSNETFYMFYCAVGEEGRGIGLITSNPL
ncbi:hypothetical protein ACHAXM_002333 [Skeletonema potamos]